MLSARASVSVSVKPTPFAKNHGEEEFKVLKWLLSFRYSDRLEKVYSIPALFTNAVSNSHHTVSCIHGVQTPNHDRNTSEVATSS